MWLYSLAIKCSGDIEGNPGPKPNSCEYLSICHWNLNSISLHSLIKLPLLRAYISINKIDIICLSETYLDSSISLIMTTWSYQGIIQYAQIILLIPKEAMFAFIIIILYS